MTFPQEFYPHLPIATHHVRRVSRREAAFPSVGMSDPMEP